MNFAEYMESKFVSHQISITGQTTPLQHAEGQAVLAWLWVVVKVVTIFHMFKLLGSFTAQKLHIIEAPRLARQIARDYQLDQMEKVKASKEIAEQVLKDGEAANLSPSKGNA